MINASECGPTISILCFHHLSHFMHLLLYQKKMGRDGERGKGLINDILD